MGLALRMILFSGFWFFAGVVFTFTFLGPSLEIWDLWGSTVKWQGVP